jgi:hypothetical protein
MLHSRTRYRPVIPRSHGNLGKPALGSPIKIQRTPRVVMSLSFNNAADEKFNVPCSLFEVVCFPSENGVVKLSTEPRIVAMRPMP